MADLKVTHGNLDLASTDLNTASTNLQTLIDDLNRELDKRQASWTGSAKEAYVPAKAQWNGAISDMRELLFDLGKAVNESNLSYLNADIQGSKLFS
ncbi:MAG TPA: WXG100 family type VII secretion target [Kribbellaceae bacterium]|jgi:WXG100 family type VII secretion target|nr:WXG100 family type VII secretion target [Kribbellaceae bacterium]